MVSKVPTKQLGTQTTLSLQGVACDASVYVGAVIRLSGSTFVNALADSKANSHVFGICTAKPTTTTADVLLPGGLTDSIYSGLDVTEEYFLSTTVAGDITTTVPTTAGHVVWRIGKPLNATQLLFDPVLRGVRA